MSFKDDQARSMAIEPNLFSAEAVKVDGSYRSQKYSHCLVRELAAENCIAPFAKKQLPTSRTAKSNGTTQCNNPINRTTRATTCSTHKRLV